MIITKITNEVSKIPLQEKVKKVGFEVRKASNLSQRPPAWTESKWIRLFRLQILLLAVSIYQL